MWTIYRICRGIRILKKYCMASSQKLPKTDFSENREGGCYSVRTAPWATPSWKKCKDMTTGRLTSKKKNNVWVSIRHEDTADAALSTWVEFKFWQVLFPEQRLSLENGQDQRAPRKEKLLFWIYNNRMYFSIPNVILSNQWGKSALISKFVKDSRVDFFWLLKSNELQIKQGF